MPATACDFLRLPATACDCLQLLATACDCLRLLATACECMRLSVATCDCLRLPRILGGWPEIAHLESENMVSYWVPELGPKIRVQFQMIGFPLEFMLPIYGQYICVVFVQSCFPSSSIFSQCFSVLVILCEDRDGDIYFWRSC